MRASGILLHPTSLPSRYGVGDLGQAAYDFIDFLARTNQQYWQVLPIGPTGYGNSPYMCYSAIAGNPIMISLDQLVEAEFLTNDDVENLPDFSEDQVDFDRVIAYKNSLFQIACENFQKNASKVQKKEFDQFCQQHQEWLDDYALFMALKKTFDQQSWHQWEPELASRAAPALKEWSSKLSADIFYQKFVQFCFFQQWKSLKDYANKKRISIIGDIPIYVAHDSADVWVNPENFCLDEETGEVALMAGVPPDYFSETGQLWGNPIYNWEKMAETNFTWWVKRFKYLLELVDLIRADHFRGFESYWAVPKGEKTAVNGEWMEGPKAAFFEAMQKELGEIPIIAEDLGVITPEVEALRDNFKLPGMKILQFAFGGGPTNPYLPFCYDRNCVVYTGTHDNDTTVGWFEKLGEEEKNGLSNYLGSLGADGVHWDLIRLAMASVSNFAIIPLQDLLGLGSDARMNMPGTATGNWSWRYRSNVLTDNIADRLKKMTHIYGRDPLEQSRDPLEINQDEGS